MMWPFMPAASSMANAKSREGLIQRAAESEAGCLTPKKGVQKEGEDNFLLCILKKEEQMSMWGTGSVVPFV